MNDKINPGFLKKICEWLDQARIFGKDWYILRLITDANRRSISDLINCGFLLRICMWRSWLQILTEDLWITKSIANSCWKSMFKQIDRKFKRKIYKWQDQLRIIVEDLYMNRWTADLNKRLIILTADFDKRSMSDKINRRVLFKICV